MRYAYGDALTNHIVLGVGNPHDYHLVIECANLLPNLIAVQDVHYLMLNTV